MSEINGYFESKGGLGKLTISGFKFIIRGLSTDFTTEYDFEVKHWDKLISLCYQGDPV